MRINEVNGIAGLRAALDAPADQQDRVFNERITDPLRPVLEPMLSYMPELADPQAMDSGVKLARTFGFYAPEDGVEQGRAAVDMLDKARSWDACREAVDRAAAALKGEEHGVSIAELLFAVLVMSPEQALKNPKSGGYTGWGGRPGMVTVMAWPSEYNVPRIPAAVVHEFNHNVRFSIEPWTMETTMGQYMVAEGLAEAFEREMYGEEMLGPWATLLTEAELEGLKPKYHEALELTGDIRGYIFGDWAAEAFHYTPREVPDFAGYSMGYRLVRAYVERAGCSVAEATYVPWREIVAKSGYFQ
jgi:uncharacterized protein YjaZ